MQQMSCEDNLRSISLVSVTVCYSCTLECRKGRGMVGKERGIMERKKERKAYKRMNRTKERRKERKKEQEGREETRTCLKVKGKMSDRKKIQ